MGSFVNNNFSLADGEVVHVKPFRFTLESQHLKKDFINAVDFDYQNKKFTFKAYEIFLNDEIAIDVWINGMRAGKYPEENFVFRTYDGCGNGLYHSRFYGIFIVGESADFSMDNSGNSLRSVTIAYKVGQMFKNNESMVTRFF